MKKTLVERLHEKSELVPFSGCRIWTGDHDKDGYGWLVVDGKRQSTHRLSYRAFKGEPQHFVCHTCDVTSCINPDHLYDGTNAQNMADKVKRGRSRMATMARGERHGRAWLTSQQVLRIREMRDQGFSMRQIANAFGMKSSGHVANIVNRRIWNFLP